MISVQAPARRRFGPSLTPLIDVVFLLLVFFMLAARFGVEDIISLSVGGAAVEYEGPPRLVTVELEGITLNGVATALPEIPEALSRMMDDASDVVVLRLANDADLQALVGAATFLREAGLTNLVVVE